MANSSGDSLTAHNTDSTVNTTYICRVCVKIRGRVEGVNRIPIGIRYDHYAIEKIFTSANMTMIEFDK